MAEQRRSEKSLFLEAIEKADTGERAAFLDEACRDDATLRAEVEALLRAHDTPQSLLDAAPEAETTDRPPLAARPGVAVGPYRLLEQIGEGGFGVVFLAEQTQPVRRQVALKLIKPGMDTKQVIARFEAERQALALMNHPNIARVLDAGATSSGRPYFVMEYVKGLPITDFCDQDYLTPRQRLELFVQVCQAVQHAHQKGIIHRDLKPSNILVTMHDTTPVVKVIDFGIAKALGQQLTDRTLFTCVAQMVGTPLYMSPEQAGLSGLDVDTRSDIYSLGVLLYELLAGTTPFDKERFRKAAYDEICRILREEEPPRPSTRLSAQRLAAETVSANRQSEPRKLRRLLRGELDWVVMKALEKDRSHRYETASAFADDVRRFLHDEPVLAFPPSRWYRFRKFARRNSKALATTSVVAAVLLMSVAVLATSTILIAREQQATENALRSERRAKEELRRDSYFHRISLAHRELSVNNLKRALQLLEECPEDLREWEWHYLKRLCRVEPIVLRDKTEVIGLSFSPNGESLASVGGDGAIKVWSMKTGRVIQSLEQAHRGFACSVAFHPQGKHIASVGADRQLKVWDLTSGQVVFASPCDGVHAYGTAHAMAFSPLDGRQLAAGSDGGVTVWDWKTGQVLHTFAGHHKHRINLAYSRDGRRLASANWAGGVTLWDAEAGGSPLRTFPETRHPVGALAFNQDAGWLAVASYNRRVEVWDTTTGGLVHRLRHTDGLVVDVAFSPDGRRLASTGEDKAVRVWDTTTGREVLSLRGHTGRCGCLAFSPDGLRLASASEDTTIRVWDATPLQGHEAQEALTVQASNEIWSLAVSPDGQRIASTGSTMPVKVLDARTGLASGEFPGHSTIGFCVAWHGQRIAAAGGDGALFNVKVWDTLTNRELFTVPEQPSGTEFFAAAFSPDDRYLVTGSKDGKVLVWDARNGQPVGTLGTHDREVRAVVLDRDGSHVASVSGDGKVKVWAWNPTRLGQAPKFLCQAWISGVFVDMAFSPDSRWLATAGEGHTVKIWDVRTGQERETLRGHTGDVCAVAFSPDGRWLATAGEDTTLRIWDARSWKPRHTLRGHTGLVSSLAFLPKRQFLVSGSRDHTVKVWDATQWEEVPDR